MPGLRASLFPSKQGEYDRQVELSNAHAAATLKPRQDHDSAPHFSGNRSLDMNNTLTTPHQPPPRTRL